MSGVSEVERWVESLYPPTQEQPKAQTRQLVRAMKGAISISKSRTGEIVYRVNRFEQHALARRVFLLEQRRLSQATEREAQARVLLHKRKHMVQLRLRNRWRMRIVQASVEACSQSQMKAPVGANSQSQAYVEASSQSHTSLETSSQSQVGQETAGCASGKLAQLTSSSRSLEGAQMGISKRNKEQSLRCALRQESDRSQLRREATDGSLELQDMRSSVHLSIAQDKLQQLELLERNCVDEQKVQRLKQRLMRNFDADHQNYPMGDQQSPLMYRSRSTILHQRSSTHL